MQETDLQRVHALRAVIADFLRKRLDDKLEKIKDTDAEGIAKRAECWAAHQPATWLEDAARRVAQIQAVTHSLKPIHPDAKGTNLYCPPSTLAALDGVVGSHCLGADFAGDVVGNAAALDVYKFLKLEYQGQSLLTLVLAGDADLAAALSEDGVQAQAWMAAFAGLVEPRGRVSSHTLAKQLYWPTGSDPHDDTQYHLLAPLYASALAHRVWEQLQDDRFSEAAKEARKAKDEKRWSDRPVREYRHLAVQQLGGTKPQNISQLNSERRGNNSLLASLPPRWQSLEVKPLWRTDTLFKRFEHWGEVRSILRSSREFLLRDPRRTRETRQRLDACVETLTDEFLQFTALLHTLEPGWSQSPECRLGSAQRHWLDPEGVAQTCHAQDKPLPTDTAERISSEFALWFNEKLREGRSGEGLPVGDPEYLKWRRSMEEHIKAYERGEHDDD